jgi:DNA replication factor GINS
VEELFQTLRQIQKKERSNSTLARVEEDFYESIHKYLDKLRESTGNDPFSDEYYLLKDTQRIATEICERREHKITDAAVMNIHRSYHLFTGKPKFDLLDTTPLNLTPEEEKFYFSLLDTLKNHRTKISLDKFKDNEEKPIDDEIKPKKIESKVKPKETLSINDKNNDFIKETPSISDKTKNLIKKTPSIKDDVPKMDNSIKEEDISNIYANIDQFKTSESSLNRELDNETILIFDNIDSIMGVDEKSYGPFRPQDIVVIPTINAKIITRSKKGRVVKI